MGGFSSLETFLPSPSRTNQRLKISFISNSTVQETLPVESTLRPPPHLCPTTCPLHLLPHYLLSTKISYLGSDRILRWWYVMTRGRSLDGPGSSFWKPFLFRVCLVI